MTNYNFIRGSEWRKWDLHLHSCYTYLNSKGFPCDDNGQVIEGKFIEAVKESGISAIGLTNYFKFCDEDFILKNRLEKLGIKVFLNLELRLSLLNHETQSFDYHIIFDDTISDATIKRFLSNMDADIGDTSKKLCQLSTNEIENEAQVNFDMLMEKLDEESSGLRGKYLLGFLSRGHGSARTRGRDETNYKKIASKSHFLIHSSDSPNNIIRDRNFWLNESQYQRPLLQGSDAHDLDNIGSKYSWIKADLSFDGLRQIIFEPEDRISLEINCPDKKNDYQVIDKIKFTQYDINNNPVEKIILFNSNLNTIIGGRSNGKSTLTNSIAQALKNKDFKSNNRMFTFKNEESVQVIWRDGQVNRGEEGQRNVEFLPQNYMIRIAEDDDLRNKLIEDTVKADAENFQKIMDFDNLIQSTHNKINDLIRDWSMLKNDLLKLAPPEGDKIGVEKQLEKLNNQIADQQEKNNFSNEDNDAFILKRAELEAAKNCKNKAEIDLNELRKIVHEEVEIKAEFSGLSSELQEQLNQFLFEQQEKLNIAWKLELSKIQEQQNKTIDVQKHNINQIITNISYKNGQDNILSNETLRKLTEQVKEETQKLNMFLDFEERANDLKLKIKEKEAEIILLYSEFKKLRDDLSNNFNVKATLVKIELNFLPIDFESNIDYLYGRNTRNNEFIQSFNADSDKEALLIFEDLDLNYNKNKTQIDLIKDIFSRQWFKRNYTLKFEDDDFLKMSQGKKAFVILTLILEFSKDKKPVIIDQPEDSLDNRAIYIELTKYLKLKKKERQIILVTHNPNVVVGADSENVIIANQHSDISRNNREIQFDYTNGSLENSVLSNKDSAPEFLNSQGIREHVIEILEGGSEAFKKREEKYNFVK